LQITSTEFRPGHMSSRSGNPSAKNGSNSSQNQDNRKSGTFGSNGQKPTSTSSTKFQFKNKIIKNKK